MIQRSITDDYSSVYEVKEEFTESNLYIKRMREMAFSLDFVGDVMLPAHAYKGKKSCGEWVFKGCLNHDKHVDGCTYCRKVEQHCGSMSCNTCFEKTIQSRARSVADRLTAFANLKKNRKIYMRENRVRVLLHNVFSPPQELHYKFKTKEGRKELKKELKKVERYFDIDGGVTIAHPYRFTEDLKSAYFSPHYHKISTGWIDSDIVKRVYEETGWIVSQLSNFDNDKECYNVVKYLLSHEAVFLKEPFSRSSEHSISYYGECQNRKFKVESVLKYSEDGYDQLNKIFQKKITKKIKGQEYHLSYVTSDYYEVTNSIKNSVGKFEQYHNLTVRELTKTYGKYITPKQQDLTSRDNPAMAKSDPFEFIQMRLDYADSTGCIVESEYLNIILSHSLENLCPECTLSMRVLVPDSNFSYHKEDFEELWKILPEDGKTMKVDSLSGFSLLDYHTAGFGLQYCTEKAEWCIDDGVYELPKITFASLEMRKTLERTVAYQQFRYLEKMDLDKSKEAKKLEQIFNPVNHIQSDNHTIEDFS